MNYAKEQEVQKLRFFEFWRRPCTAARMLFLIIIVWMQIFLVACSAKSVSDPRLPYGMPLKMAEKGASVEFEVKILKAGKFDLVLEYFKAFRGEAISPDFNQFNVDINLTVISVPSGDVVFEKKVKGVLKPRTGFTPAKDDSAPMSSTFYLSPDFGLDIGTYRVVAVNQREVDALGRRLIKLNLSQTVYRK